MKQREIKFKAKRLDNGEWIYGDLAHGKLKNDMFISKTSILGTDLLFDDFPVAPETVCQFTGLKDKNGQDVYEGDILRFVAENGKQYIRYSEYRFGGFLLIDTESGLGDELRWHQENGNMAWEIIGNKFDKEEI